jgi:hypothetical protein
MTFLDRSGLLENQHVWTLKEIPVRQTSPTIWTSPDRSRPKFQRQGGKTGGPPQLLPDFLATQKIAGRSEQKDEENEWDGELRFLLLKCKAVALSCSVGFERDAPCDASQMAPPAAGVCHRHSRIIVAGHFKNQRATEPGLD